jgi:hypothetical protein
MRNVVIGAAVLALSSTMTQPLPATSIETTASEITVHTCTRVAGSQLGQLPLEIEVGDKTVRFSEWTNADELSPAVYGFATQLPRDVTFTVQAGERTFTSTSPRWLHPLDVSDAPIDSVTFCTLSRPSAIAAR